MDDVERAYRRLQFENAFLRKRGEAFQDWVADILSCRHPNDFRRVRPWGSDGDRKNDGYIGSTRQLLQVYAPNEMNAREAIAKINEDFEGAKVHWGAHFDEWIFVHNARAAGGLGPHILERLLELDAAGPPRVGFWGLEELWNIFVQLSSTSMQDLFGPAFTRRDVVQLRLETLAPLLDQLEHCPAPTAASDLRPPPPEKIRYNLLSPSVELLLKAGMSKVELVRQYFRVLAAPTRRVEVVSILRARYEECRAAGLAPDSIFGNLQRYIAGGEPQPHALVGAFAVLAYFFEECDIFEREPLAAVSDDPEHPA